MTALTLLFTIAGYGFAALFLFMLGSLLADLLRIR